MEKYAWITTLKPNKKEEYIKRHNEIWPSMKEVLTKAGIVNYSIWIVDDKIFGYYECEYGKEYASKIQNESEVVKKWDEYMKDVTDISKDPITKAQLSLEQVFDFNGR